MDRQLDYSALPQMSMDELRLNLSFYKVYDQDAATKIRDEINGRNDNDFISGPPPIFQPEENAEIPAQAKCSRCKQMVPLRRDGTMVSHKWQKRFVTCDGSNRKMWSCL